ncbi:MAG TPA: hypothetical protein VFL64_19885 [Rhizobacter sp.]|nr:hypothetical protein [Rhizobacter sp.]
MQAINASVGDNGSNDPSDVALVQAALVKTVRPAAPGRPPAPYLANYDGTCGPNTKAAIRNFQADRVFVSAAGNASAPNPNATAGLVRPGDATWAQLVARLPPEFVNLRVLPGGRIVYIEATPQELQTKLLAAAALTFAPAFGPKVRNCIGRMHQQHGIAVGVCPQGDRRSFQAQYALLTGGGNVTNAGPGESNHNFGMATDIGFAGLRWLHADGVVDANETPWLHHLTAQNAAQALLFWKALRTVGTSGAVGAFRGPIDDHPHLQNWNDANVSMKARLAAHLQASGSMRWSLVGSTYHCDLGLGGAQVEVGRAAQIWNLNAALTPASLSQARAAAAAAQHKPAPAAATAADVEAMRQLLRQQFDLADTNWRAWTPQ